MKSKGQKLYQRARQIIPGGTQLLSKRPEMFLPGGWPCYYSRAKGVTVWDLDGKAYMDMSLPGIGSTILGYADPEVDAAVSEAIAGGSMTTLNPPEEVALAELLIELHPWAEMARFLRSGGEAMPAAVRIARAASGKDKLAFCGYHGWHDWYLAANLSSDEALDAHLLPGLAPTGVPRALAGTAFPFRYNHPEELEAIVAEHGAELGVIVLETIRNHEPKPGFLARVRELAEQCNAVLLVDEITAAWRLNSGGAHLLYDLEPDVAVFAKGLSNGYPMAAVIGKRAVMDAAQSTFLSSTFWTDRIGPAAALATVTKHRRENVAEHLKAIGSSVRAVWKEAAEANDLDLEITGIPPLQFFSFTDAQGNAMRTLFTQVLLDRGFLAKNLFYATFAHHEDHVTGYRAAVQEAFETIAKAKAEGKVESELRGPPAHTGFHRLT